VSSEGKERVGGKKGVGEKRIFDFGGPKHVPVLQKKWRFQKKGFVYMGHGIEFFLERPR